MNDDRQAIARACLSAAESDSMIFPEIVGKLMSAGFESYAVDFRRSTAIYYSRDGETVQLVADGTRTPVAHEFDVAQLQSAIREAQTQAPGYTYRGFLRKAAEAGCAGYLVSFVGRRAVYFGRTGETHVEFFPDN